MDIHGITGPGEGNKHYECEKQGTPDTAWPGLFASQLLGCNARKRTTTATTATTKSTVVQRLVD